MNRTIRARIHESAVKRVTRIYAATLADIFAETLQNSRRAGATRVRIAVSGSSGAPDAAEPYFTVTVADDGAGIADPAVLLSFGENGWDDALVRREDAAGFGFASLARRNCTVSSRPRSTDREIAPGWRVELAPEHFLGEADAEVRADEQAPYPQGTADFVPGGGTCRRDPQRGGERRPPLSAPGGLRGPHRRRHRRSGRAAASRLPRRRRTRRAMARSGVRRLQEPPCRLQRRPTSISTA